MFFREQQARDEVGITTIRPVAAAVFTSIFLLFLFGVLFIDHLVERNTLDENASVLSLRSLKGIGEISEVVGELRKQEFQPDAWITANRSVLQYIKRTEEDIEEQAAVAKWLRPWLQNGLLFLGVGNEKVYPGKDSWLFYRSDVDSVSGPGFLDPSQLSSRINETAEWEKSPQPDPLPALIDFHKQLAARGIRLLIVPIPVKPEIAAGKFTSRLNRGERVANASFQPFIDALTDAGVWVVDVAVWMEEFKQANEAVPFLRTDTHWTPFAMQWVAEHLASELNEELVWDGSGTALQALEPRSVTNQGDIAAMLDLHSPYPPETVDIRQVTQADGSIWRASAAAELLVLGDSFSNIFSVAGMGWGESAGLVEHLSLALQQPIDRIVMNDQGAFASRQLLSRELARGRDRLAGKKVVLYQFASRELAQGDWKKLPLDLQAPSPSTFLSLDAGEQIKVRGLVREVSSVPRPGSVPYRDHVVSIHLLDVRFAEHSEVLSQAVVFLQSMSNNVWTRAARLRPGDEIDLILSNWGDMADVKDGLNRSELDALEMQLQEPLWGELLEK